MKQAYTRCSQRLTVCINRGRREVLRQQHGAALVSGVGVMCVIRSAEWWGVRFPMKREVRDLVMPAA